MQTIFNFKSVRRIALTLVGIFLVIQFVPYGRDHTNPPVLQEPNWDSPATRATAVRACFECHSNETVWPWYSNIAPASWLIYRDVAEGREHMNFSEWGLHPEEEAGEGEGHEHEHGFDVVRDMLESRRMPLFYYLWFHPEARLTTVELEEFLHGLEHSLGE